MNAKKYRKRHKQSILAIQIKLDTPGFCYMKWGGEQKCHADDWLVNNNGDYYTISNDSFTKTYEEISPGHFAKTAPVWAYKASQAGTVKTTEGSTAYLAGDYLVANNPDGSDGYAVPRGDFENMYEEINDID